MKASVCLATYNGEKFIGTQVESILSQIGPEDEIVVSDDGSVDDTISILNSFQDKRIKVYFNTGNRNPVHNFENAIKRSSGDVVFLSDQDDIWIAGKVKKILEAFKRPNTLAVVSDAMIINDNEDVIMQSYFAVRKSGPGFFKNLYKNSFLGCTMAFRGTVKKYILPFPKNVPMHDEWIGLICSLHGKVTFLKEQLILYRRHDGNVTNMHRNSWWKVIAKRRKLIYLLSVRQIKILLSRITKTFTNNKER